MSGSGETPSGELSPDHERRPSSTLTPAWAWPAIIAIAFAPVLLISLPFGNLLIALDGWIHCLCTVVGLRLLVFGVGSPRGRQLMPRSVGWVLVVLVIMIIPWIVAPYIYESDALNAREAGQTYPPPLLDPLELIRHWVPRVSVVLLVGLAVLAARINRPAAWMLGGTLISAVVGFGNLMGIYARLGD